MQDQSLHELSIIQKRLDDEKTLRILDHSRRSGQLRRFLSESINQPLSDAQDALSFDPPNVEAALQRIQMVMSALKIEENILKLGNNQ